MYKVCTAVVWWCPNLQLNGVPEWKALQQGDLRELGFLPFPVDDIMCPGETKALHLYEVEYGKLLPCIRW